MIINRTPTLAEINSLLKNGLTPWMNGVRLGVHNFRLLNTNNPGMFIWSACGPKQCLEMCSGPLTKMQLIQKSDNSSILHCLRAQSRSPSNV